MTPNVENLKKLRDIINQVPPEHFSMVTFFGTDTDPEGDPEGELDPVDVTEPIAEIIKHRCGSVGCMVGWGALDLHLNPNRLTYADFCDEMLGIEHGSEFWDALFGGEWGVTDYCGNPIVPSDEQKTAALNRLNDVIGFLTDDPEWLNTDDATDWIDDRSAEIREIETQAH